VNRADFIPDVIWVIRDGRWAALHRADDPEGWLGVVNSNCPVITQLDDGNATTATAMFPTSSSSGRVVMDEMLTLLDVHSGVDVLEIGTGTGYNAAIIAELVAPGRVTSVEIDRFVADQARKALGRVGSEVAVVTGDGTYGYADNAPYDRVIGTASAIRVPFAWVEQTRPQGRIVLPVAGSFGRDAFVCLTTGDDGKASGPFHGDSAFMRLRDQRDEPFFWWGKETSLRKRVTRLFPGDPFLEFEAGFVLGLLCPGWIAVRRVTNGVTFIEVSDPSSRSGASLAADDPTTDDEDFEIIQYGPRNLWDELEAAYRWWLDAGRPDHTRFGLTVTKDGQHVWLDNPGQVVEIPLA
jgi:protein-L-isoaspartate(D-aspartate) O-methyltransferase